MTLQFVVGFIVGGLVVQYVVPLIDLLFTIAHNRLSICINAQAQEVEKMQGYQHQTNVIGFQIPSSCEEEYYDEDEYDEDDA